MNREYESISKWFDRYFEDVRNNQGDIETVPNLKKYFAEDFELTLYTAPAPNTRLSMSREDLLLSFVHPGLQEDIAPRHYALDAKQMLVAVQFEIHFIDRISGKDWPRLEASAHYHLIVDSKTNFKIDRIRYWTEALPADLLALWAERREKALTQ